jgi:hypothetical protein
MKNDPIIIRILLIIIAVLLIINIVILKTSDLEELLNEYSKKGWEAISVNVVAIGLGGKALVVFKK